MNQSRFVNKTVKDYELTNFIAKIDNHSQIVKGVKNFKLVVTVYALVKSDLNAQKFVQYNKTISQNQSKIFPTELQLIQSQKSIYMIFEEFVKPTQITTSFQQRLSQLQYIYKHANSKINLQQIFMGNGQKFCYLPSYFKQNISSVNLYNQFHNKSMLASIFSKLVKTNNQTKTNQILLNEWENPKLFQLIKPFIGQNKNQYPVFDDDDKQIEALMSCVHINPSFKQQAGEQYLRTSSRKNNEGIQSKQIGNIVDGVKESMFDIKCFKDPKKKSKYELKLNQTKFEQMEFQVRYELYYKIFKLFKKGIRSYLQKYPKGFSGIIAAYLLTVIGILRRLQIVVDLEAKADVFEIGLGSSRSYQKQVNKVKKQLLKQAKIMINLRDIIENSRMPMKTYEILAPFLEDIENIDRLQTQNFCFFYLTIILRQNWTEQYHSMFAIQILFVLINRNYQIIYSEQDFPQYWDKNYFDMRKLLIESTIPKWTL